MKYLLVAALLTTAAALAVDAPPKPAGLGKTYVNPNGGTVLKPLTDPKMYGGTEVDVAELTFPPHIDSGDHVHGSVETFYVPEGELEHVANGKSIFLKPGMVGTVRPPDKVRHKTERRAQKPSWCGRPAARWRASRGAGKSSKNFCANSRMGFSSPR